MATPEVPASLKPVVGFLKLANDNERLDPVVSYWCRFYAVQYALKVDSKSQEAKIFLLGLMDKLEMEKKALKDNEAVSSEIVGQAHVENYGMRLFEKADNEDRALQANVKTVKAFFTAAQFFEVLSVFGETSPEIAQRTKYAKWRAAVIMKALKSGEQPPPPENNSEFGSNPSDVPPPSSSYNQPPQPGFSAAGGFSDGFPEIPSDFPQVPEASHSLELTNRDKLSSFHSVDASEVPADLTEKPLLADNGAALDPAALMKAQKYCKFAQSSMQYNDTPTAIGFLEKALSILKFGSE